MLKDNQSSMKVIPKLAASNVGSDILVVDHAPINTSTLNFV